MAPATAILVGLDTACIMALIQCPWAAKDAMEIIQDLESENMSLSLGSVVY